MLEVASAAGQLRSIAGCRLGDKTENKGPGIEG